MIVFCTTCKNRTQHLRLTLPRNLADNPYAKFVVLDYNTQDDLLEYLFTEHGAEIESGRLVVYSHLDAPIFRMAHAKNMAHRCGMLEGGTTLVNLDADNLTGEFFDVFIRGYRRDDTFFWANMVKGAMPRGISGRIVVSDNAFLKAGGYDEHKFNGWGSDDKDFNIRLRNLGYNAAQIPQCFLNGIPHNNKMRFREYPHLAHRSDDYFIVNPARIKRDVVNGGRIGCGTVYRNGDFTRPIELKPLPTRIFGIGLHKTATTSLHHALQELGYESWHWSSAHAAKAIWREMNEQGHSHTLEQYHALTDLPIPLLYKQLDAAYTGSKFILTVRDERQWLDAVERHFNPRYNKWQAGWNQDPFTNRVHQFLYGRQTFDRGVFLAAYRQHLSSVLYHFRSRPDDLLIMNMDVDGWPALCRFLHKPIPAVPYPRANSSKGDQP